jgi:hypothetical protein
MKTLQTTTNGRNKTLLGAAMLRHRTLWKTAYRTQTVAHLGDSAGVTGRRGVAEIQIQFPPETTEGGWQTIYEPAHRSLPLIVNTPTMIRHLIDAYVVGFSALTFYVLRTYFEARAVWKQFGSVVPDFSCGVGSL